MIDRVQIKMRDGLVLVSGEISFITAFPLWKKSLKLLSDEGSWHFDFSEVTFCNSAGLALILEWLKLAKQKSKKIEFQQVPRQLQAMAAAAGLDDLLGTYLVVKEA